MSTPRRVEAKAVASEAADSEVVRLLAILAKASFTYQESNRRTQEACAGFRSALLARVGGTGNAFVLENRSDGLYTATGKEPAELLRDWLRNTFQKALLGAIRIDGGVSARELLNFFARLRSNTFGRIRKDATFEALWPERCDGLELRELRFFGGYYLHDPQAAGGADSGSMRAAMSDGSAELRTALLRLGLSDAQLQRILAIERRLAGLQTQGGDGESLSLPREMLAALPADVVDDPATRPVFVDRLLDRFEQLLDGPDLTEEGAPKALGSLVELFRKLPQAFFHSGSRPGARPPPSEPHRPEDRADEFEDPARLVSLFAALPERTIRLEPDEATLQAETLRVCLHQLGADASPRVTGPAAAKVKKILARAAPESRGVLEHYVRQALLRNESLPPPAVVDRLMLRLHDYELLPELRRQGGLTVERIVRCFPNAFVPFLRSLDEKSTADAEVLARALKALDANVLAAGVEQLLRQQEILEPALLRKLFRIGGRSALALARAMLSSRNPALQEEIVAWLRELGGGHPEAVPLSFLEIGRLPASYLEDLCEFVRTGKPNPRLRSQAGGLLYAFIEATPNDFHGLPLKARAILGLAAFPGPSSEALLKQALRGEGLLGPLYVPAAIRDAARTVRARWKEGTRV